MDPQRKYPPFVLALLPLILVVVLFSITNSLAPLAAGRFCPGSGHSDPPSYA